MGQVGGCIRGYKPVETRAASIHLDPCRWTFSRFDTLYSDLGLKDMKISAPYLAFPCEAAGWVPGV